MVISRDQAQRRSKKVVEPTTLAQAPPGPENGKRTKVHAQRKFAQGSALSSPALTPVKDKSKNNGSLLPAEIIPAKRPKTHDFLTFLCLRGTPILPTRLDFFAVSSSENQDDDFSNSAVSKGSAKVPTKPEKLQDIPNFSGRRNETLQQNSVGPKRRSSAPVPTNAVQALKKKYQDQRLSKQNRSGVLNKLAQKVKDKNMVRTRSTGQTEPQKKPASPTEVAKPKLPSKPSLGTANARRATRSSGLPLSPVVVAVKSPKKRIGLRSGRSVKASREEVLDKARKARRDKARDRAAAAAAAASKSVASRLSDFSSEDDEPLANKTRSRASSSECAKSSAKQIAMQRLKQAKARQRKASLSPVHMKTRSRRGEQSTSVSPERKEAARESISQNPQKPPARLSRKTKEAAAVYMELLGHKWMSPDDDDDEEDGEDADNDSLSLYSFPELRRHSAEKKSSEVSGKKQVKKKPEVTKKEPEISKKKAKVESRENLPEEKKEEKIVTRQRSVSTSSPSPTRRSSATLSPQRRSSVASPPSQRRSLRGMAPPPPLPSPRKVREFTESDDEPLGKRVSNISKKSEVKHAEGKKKLKKKDKPDKMKSSLSSIAKRTRLRSEKLRLSKESKKGTLNKLLEQTRKKYLCTRKSKAACIQELVKSTLERLNKEEKAEMKKAQAMELQVEKSVKSETKVLDPVLLDKKLRTLSNTLQEEKVISKKEKDLTPVSKHDSKTTKVDPKVKPKSPNKIGSTPTKPASTLPRLVAKKTASVQPAVASTKKTLQVIAPKEPTRSIQERSVSLPCSPLECRTTLTHPEASKQASHCTTCGRGEATQQVKTTEGKKDVTPTKKVETVNSAVKNLNWSNLTPVKAQSTQSIKASSTVVTAQKISPVIPPPLLTKPSQSVNQSTGVQHQQSTTQILPTCLTEVPDMKKFVSGLAMLQPTNQRDIVLLAPQNSSAGKFIVCRKEELAALEATAGCSSSGLQYMVVPTGITTQEKTTTSIISKAVPVTAGPSSDLRNFRFKKIESTESISVQTQELKIVEKSKGTNPANLVPKSPDEKRPIFQRRREKLLHSKRSEAFSPENESSVYAFQTDPEEVLAGIPFRRSKNKDDSNSNSNSNSITPPATSHSVACSTDSPPMKHHIQPVLASVPAVSSTPLNTFVSRNVSSNSIAVQVNFDEVASTSSESPLESPISPNGPANSALRSSFECSTQTEEENEDDHLFYIPLQRGAPAPQQLIQGVEVKLGTEGPTGPNQRVIMRAKLVTKAPERFSAALNTTGMVRSSQHPTSTLGSAAASSSSSKTPLVGTVQPTTRSLPHTVAALPATVRTPSIPLRTPKPGTSQAKQTKPVTSTPVASKPQKLTGKRNSTEHTTPSPSTSSAKPAGKRPPVQRQASTTSSGSNAKSPRVIEPIATPASFPAPGSPAHLLEAPIFHPTEKEFQDPMEYIERIRPIAEQFGLCRIVPPSSFKPECKVSDDMRFTAYNHYVHKMLDRWGPNVKETTAIKKYLKSQNVAYTHPPWIGGMEIDLPRFYQTVQQCGGLMEVIEKKKWQRVADAMKIPKSAQDRVTKLDDIYCKFLLAYDTLSPEERQVLFDEVEEEWAKKQQLSDSTEDESFDESEECITKGRNMPLNAFYRIARNTMSMWFRTSEPGAQEVEAEYWRLAQERANHVCVHAGSIDSGVWGYGFPCNKNSPCAKHPWNLKVLSNNSGTVLRSMGSLIGVTVPTLHVGMLFSTFCWYRDPHSLPWIEYLHTGASKIWYGIPDSQSSIFRNTLTKVVPKYCRDQTTWLPSDTAMVPPSLLVPHGVSVCRTVQEPGQFILVFPRAFTSSICTGYLVSESVYFAQPRWLASAENVFRELKNSCEPTVFSLERLLFSIAQDHRCSVEVLRQVQPQLQRVVEREESQREDLRKLGLKSSERLPLPDAASRRRRPRTASEDEKDHECEVCRANLYVSLVTNSHEEGVYCLSHAITLLTKKHHHLKFCKLLYTYDMEELHDLLQQLDEKIEIKSAKKAQGKHGTSSK